MIPIRILIVDDHPIIRSGIRTLIESFPDLLVVGEASDGTLALDAIQRHQPDVVTLDMSMGKTSGLDCLEKLREQTTDVAVVALTMHDELAYIRGALRRGALGYVLKSSEPTELISAIRAVHSGRIFIDKNCADMFMKSMSSDSGSESSASSDTGADQLSLRETQVLSLLARGFTNKQVADRLYLSIKTIETYRTRLNNKLGFRTRAELVQYAVDHKLMDTD